MEKWIATESKKLTTNSNYMDKFDVLCYFKHTAYFKHIHLNFLHTFYLFIFVI